MPLPALSAPTLEAISAWLEQFDGLPLECDGMTRVLSTALLQNDIEHTVVIGTLAQSDGGSAIPHFWIELANSHIIDLAARMWFGEDAPHGIFAKNDHTMCYNPDSFADDLAIPDFLFGILAGKPLSEFTPFPSPSGRQKLGFENKKLEGTLAVDSEGNLQKVYRGEHSECTDTTPIFQSKCTTLSFSDASSASCYAVQPNDPRLFRMDVSNPRVIPCYLSIKNPITNTPQDPFIEFGDLADQVGMEDALRIFQKFAEYTENTSYFESLCEEYGVESFSDVAEKIPEHLGMMIINTWVLMDDPDFISLIREKGFDGAIYAGSGATMNAVEYRVLDASQAVLALSPDLELHQDFPLQHRKEPRNPRAKYEHNNFEP